jgi:hypothetical protein
VLLSCPAQANGKLLRCRKCQHVFRATLPVVPPPLPEITKGEIVDDIPVGEIIDDIPVGEVVAPRPEALPLARQVPMGVPARPAKREAVGTGMKTAFLSGETPVKDGPANLQRGIETVGGWLYLTNQRLIFESHAFNIQTGRTIILLVNITGTRKCWTKFLNLIPLFPNSVAVATKEGKEYRFVTFDRQTWIDAIDNQRN